jgi:ribosomal protein L35
MKTMKRKTTKSLTKRIRVTRTGKIIRRLMATDHFRTRKSSKQLRDRKKGASLDYPKKAILNY